MHTDTALLIIDVQMGLVEGTEPVHQKDKLLTHINSLIARARASATPIIYIQDNDVDEIGSTGWQIHPAIAPQHDDLVIRKPESDAFYATPLRAELEVLAIKHLVVVGCKTEHCIDATCRRAVTLGYNVTLVTDAHSTTGNRVLNAEQTIAYHNYLLGMVWCDVQGEVVGVTLKSTDEAL